MSQPRARRCRRCHCCFGRSDNRRHRRPVHPACSHRSHMCLLRFLVRRIRRIRPKHCRRSRNLPQGCPHLRTRHTRLGCCHRSRTDPQGCRFRHTRHTRQARCLHSRTFPLECRYLHRRHIRPRHCILSLGSRSRCILRRHPWWLWLDELQLLRPNIPRSFRGRSRHRTWPVDNNSLLLCRCSLRCLGRSQHRRMMKIALHQQMYLVQTGYTPDRSEFQRFHPWW